MWRTCSLGPFVPASNTTPPRSSVAGAGEISAGQVRYVHGSGNGYFCGQCMEGIPREVA